MAINNNSLVNAVGGFGEMFFKTLQSERERQDKLQQQQKQFEQQTREMNLLNAYRNKMYNLEANKPFETKTGDVFQSENGIPDFNKPMWQMPQAQPKTEGTKDPRVGADGYIYRWDESKGNYIKTNLQAPEKDIKNPTSPTEPKDTKSPTIPDLSNEVDDLETSYRDYKNGNENALTSVVAKSDQLIAKAKLQGIDDMIWNAYKSGYDYNGTVEAINNYRVKTGEPELTDWQLDVIRRYYNARVPKAYKK